MTAIFAQGLATKKNLISFQAFPATAKGKMVEEEEEVLLENSPLQQYLDEIGFTDFERVSSSEVHQKLQESRFSALRTWIIGQFHKKAFTWESCLSWFVITPSTQDLEAFRKDYIAAVVDSETLNEDDLRFLSNFDPGLFKPGSPSTNNESGNETNLWVSERRLLSCFVVLVSVLLATVSDFVFTSFSVALIILCAIGIKTLIRYYFIVQYQRNLGELKTFTMQIKQLVVLLRKSIRLIQEMELLSKGYTMVVPAVPAFLEDSDNLIISVYPALRKAILKNTQDVKTCLQKSAKELILDFPLSVELAGIFTYLSTGSKGIKSVYCTEGLSVHSLKTMTLLVFNLQSEFLSRFLLCLSVEANDGKLYELYKNLFTKMNKIFGIPTKLLASSLMSIERSYHIHKNYNCFANKESIKLHPSRIGTKWTGLDTVLQSLQLHLQAGLLRVQSLQEVISKTEKENELNPTESSHINSDLETTFHWLKIDLESALSCWKEGEKSIDKLMGKNYPKQPNNVASSAMNNVNFERSAPCTLDLNKEAVDIDRVYEAFSDPYDEDFDKHGTLTAEDLEREKNAVRENKQLLQELKAVLFTKTKDPLIGTTGFVQPVKLPVDIQAGNSIDKSHKGLNSEEEALETSNGAELNDKLCFYEQLKSFEVYNELSHVEATDLQSSVAASVAAAAVMRSKAMGLSEENFISDDDSD